ncbi:MAG: hypothetical protein JNL35_00695 [Sphingopyxis sp.]|nr:hypothetical protein [Sphingopyxis sp.]
MAASARSRAASRVGQWWTHWGSADVAIGRSTYALGKGGTLTVSDSAPRADGGWRAFATLRYRRKSGENRGHFGRAYAAHKKRGPGLASRPSLSGSPLLKLLMVECHINVILKRPKFASPLPIYCAGAKAGFRPGKPAFEVLQKLCRAVMPKVRGWPTV